MSFNRGIKRDSYGANRNFNNRNMGGGGGGGGGGRMGNMGGGGMGGGGGGGGGGMNPWEGGMMPGRGILPTPNNNLSLASPQAQLAIASNLLSNLLRTQQDNQPQVPSLLSLGNNYSGPGPNFNNQQNYNQGRFNDRTGRQNIKPQRPQPYNNKMGNNNRARDGIVGRRGPQQSRAPQSGNQRQNGNQIQRNDKSSKPIAASKQNQNVKKEQLDKSSDKTNEKAEAPVALSEENEETEESKKREWKDEKNELSNEKNEDAGKTDDADKDDGDKGTGKKSAARHAESRYAEVPISNMFCHVCNKHMWDGYSFENHLRGRAHQLMMDKLDESYKLKVELMRHELRVAEEQRELSLTNSKRRGKKLSVDLSVREYCTMCDLNFYGTLSSHRKSEKHQQLKTFLHPRCFPCAKEFPSRIEYDEHCLTPTHMKNAVQNEEQRKIKKKEKLAKGESEIRSADDEEKDVGTDIIKGDKLDDSAAAADDDYVTEIPEGQIDAKLKIPSYKHCRTNQLSVGRSLVKEVTGYQCDKCRRFMLTEEDLVAHLRSITHYRNFIHEIKTLQAAAESAAKAEQEKKEGDDKADTTENSEPESKRPKLDGQENEQDENVNLNETEEKNENEDDKYDPAEANGDTDEENAEDENQEGSNENECAEISLNENEDLEVSNDNEPEEKTETPEKAPQTPRSQAANRGNYGPRARGNRARRSRR
ncbi:zinc finger protein on ecdysone puffs isoform X2 [Nasonia vitripennis]|uniref:C2H2-type domain-containing protein n=1 Tax=Nasonia vitripennis TaxID=7425 RepID=A0A7M7GIR2_NASVI|nr:zinc finger protein on ecdysone puffs isoform X2 [Nasonia vitripennis]